MKVLALEFSANERSVAVAQETSGAIEVLHVARETSREVTGLALIDRALSSARIKAEDISKIVVGLGPGSYTGIRSAIALAQGWQLGRPIQTIGISSMQALAAGAHARGMRGEFSFIIDAQRGDVYHQRFNLSSDRFEEIDQLKIVPAGEIANLTNVIGPDAARFVAGATELNPSAEGLARLIDRHVPCPAEQLEPIYFRAATFVKAPPPRQIG